MEVLLKQFEGQKVALYGLSTETERFLEIYRNKISVVGLLDGFREEGDIFGLPIMSINHIIEEQVKLIIVIARPGSCKAIEKKIGKICSDNHISLYDMRGKNLLDYKKTMVSSNELKVCLNCQKKGINISNDVKINLFLERLEKICNANEEGLKIYNAYDIGYLFIAPIIIDFILWFHKMVQQYNVPNVWFGSRDGYLIQKMYHMLKGDSDTTYFLTSRIAAIRAGIDKKEDIQYVSDMKFSGTIEQAMKERFGISIEYLKEKTSSYNQENYLNYENLIYEKVINVRNGYNEYIKQFKLKKGDIAFFDFVAKGTTQYFINRLVANHIKGFYFLQLETNLEVDVISFYTEEERNESAIFEDYYILETVLTSPEPSLIEFSKKGEPIYAQETRLREDIKCIERVQKGIIDCYKKYLERCPMRERKINKKLDEYFLRLIHNVEIQDADFLRLQVEDPFFNRRTSIIDVIE